MYEDKKVYLSQYLIQETKIQRIEKLAEQNCNNIAEYRKQIEQAVLLRNNIEKSIEQLGDPILSELLFQKYVFGKTLDEISLIINYSKRQTERLHIKALEKLSL